MIKRTLGVVLAVVILLSGFAVNTWAAYTMNQDFSEMGSEGISYTLKPDVDANLCIAEIKGGMLHMYNPTVRPDNASSDVNYTLLAKLPADRAVLGDNDVFQYDIMLKSFSNPNAYLVTNLYLGENRRLGHSFYPGYQYNGGVIANSALEENVWYTFIYQIKNGTTFDVFYKKRDEEAAFRLVKSEGSIATNHAGDAAFQLYGENDFEVFVDNIKIYNGVFSGAGKFLMNGEEISEISRLEDGVLRAEVSVVCGEFAADQSGFGSGDSVTPMMVVYDSEKMMINCVTAEETVLTPGENIISLEMDVSEFREYTKGGYVGFYVWDNVYSLRPVSKAVVLN